MKRKIMSILITAALLGSLSAPAVFADDVVIDGTTTTIQGDIMLASADDAAIPQANYIPFNVTITNITDGMIETAYVGTDASNPENVVNFMTTEDTAYMSLSTGSAYDASKLAKGDTITVFIYANDPAPLIMPPQYSARFVFVDDTKEGEEANFVGVDVFTPSEEMFVDSVNSLAFTANKNTKIMDLEGNAIEDIDEVAGKLLAVLFKETTKSIPAQTVPVAVIVLGEADAEPNAGAEQNTTEGFEDIDTYTKDGEFYVNSANTLAIRIGETTEVVDKAGNPVSADDLDGKMLAVYYTISTRSIPAQTTPEKVVVLDKENERLVDMDVYTRNGDTFVNSANTLVFTVDESTAIVDEDGNAVSVDDLDGKKLAVYYTNATKSIPAQTIAEGVVVLKDEGDITKVTKVTAGDYETEVSYDAEKNTIMVPVRAVAEALGRVVGWDGDNMGVTVDDVMFKIGYNSYIKSEIAQTLEAAPELREDTTFVPVSLFSDVFSHKISVDGNVLKIDWKTE